MEISILNLSHFVASIKTDTKTVFFRCCLLSNKKHFGYDLDKRKYRRLINCSTWISTINILIIVYILISYFLDFSCKLWNNLWIVHDGQTNWIYIFVWMRRFSRATSSFDDSHRSILLYSRSNVFWWNSSFSLLFSCHPIAITFIQWF